MDNLPNRRIAFDLKLVDNIDQLPKITFGNWVGGDCDGHPFVTDEVTSHTLFEL
ncbi:hypothetical protein BH23BAC3_BH23BAC3_30850 [soil metagenome]